MSGRHPEFYKDPDTIMPWLCSTVLQHALPSAPLLTENRQLCDMRWILQTKQTTMIANLICIPALRSGPLTVMAHTEYRSAEIVWKCFSTMNLRTSRYSKWT